ncbi:Pyridoxal-phosphate-dependent serine hydroxymethyltransferase [Gossypium australe]|uniref:Pyridoxal-phosphate-dependent serine hydroxymethyltransferase n=1 Tax=Gossypium australe TaxID=47621 RepID=A0A5B6VMA0_9ROSI|nr:Pyridoxal-phosphate-dependent serine hydroxymethyltransferase [Gossypium australe]
MGYSDKDKLGCVMSLLVDEAHHWWMTVECGTALKRVRRREFMDLVQGTLSVNEYKAKFVCLSHYAPELVAHEASRCKRFRFGMSREIKLYLVAQSVEVFDELVEKTYALEETLREEPKAFSVGAVKRKSGTISGSGRKGKRGHFGTSG